MILTRIRDGTETFFGDSESFRFRIIASETLSETWNLNRNPETAKTSIIYLFILSKVGAETFVPNPKVSGFGL